jgi:hypothetical protein
MTGQRVLCRRVWTQVGLRQLEREIHNWILEGWWVASLKVKPLWFGYICVAVLNPIEEDAGEYVPPLNALNE